MVTLQQAIPLPGGRLALVWSDGTKAEIALSAREHPVPEDEAQFLAGQIGEWGHSVEWPNGTEIGADSLWLATLRVTGREDAAEFLGWRLRNGLSLSKAAEALGLARRTVAYYSNGERRIPRTVLLACIGWELGKLSQAA